MQSLSMRTLETQGQSLWRKVNAKLSTHTVLHLSKLTPAYEQVWGACDKGLIPNSRTLEANIQQHRKTTCSVPCCSDVECYAAIKEQIIAAHRHGAEWGQT